MDVVDSAERTDEEAHTPMTTTFETLKSQIHSKGLTNSRESSHDSVNCADLNTTSANAVNTTLGLNAFDKDSSRALSLPQSTGVSFKYDVTGEHRKKVSSSLARPEKALVGCDSTLKSKTADHIEQSVWTMCMPPENSRIDLSVQPPGGVICSFSGRSRLYQLTSGKVNSLHGEDRPAYLYSMKHEAITPNAANVPPVSATHRNKDDLGNTAGVKRSKLTLVDIYNRPVASSLCSNICASLEANKPHENPVTSVTAQRGTALKVGLSELIVVSCERKKQVYCRLCSVRLKHSGHLAGFLHHYNYVKLKYPGWTAKPKELKAKLHKIVAHLVEVERDVGSGHFQRVEVNQDMYQKLAALPELKALDRVKLMVKQSFQQKSTPSAADSTSRSTGSDLNASNCVPEFPIEHKLDSSHPNDIENRENNFCQSSNTLHTCPVSVSNLDYQGGITTGRSVCGPSNLSMFLKASHESKSVIGLSSVWECQGISQPFRCHLKTFFLCESCGEKLSGSNVCEHVTSPPHQLNYMWKRYPMFLEQFWLEKDLLPEMKLDILKDVVRELAVREHFLQSDAQCVLLRQELHEIVRLAPFDRALKIVQHIRDKEKARISSPLRILMQQNAAETKKNPSKDASRHLLKERSYSSSLVDPRIARPGNRIQKYESCSSPSNLETASVEPARLPVFLKDQAHRTKSDQPNKNWELH